MANDVEFEPMLTENHQRQSVTEDKEKMRMMQEYLVSQFNDEGNRLLKGSGHGVGAGEREEPLEEVRVASLAGEVHQAVALDRVEPVHQPELLEAWEEQQRVAEILELAAGIRGRVAAIA